MTVLAASSHHPQQFARFDFALALSASKFRGIRVSDNQTSSANGRLSRERERERESDRSNGREGRESCFNVYCTTTAKERGGRRRTATIFNSI